MSFSEVMHMLHQNWFVGTIISCVVVVIAYIVVSVLIIVSNRKKGRDVAALGMIPIIQVLYPLCKGISERRAEKKAQKETLNSEIDIW